MLLNADICMVIFYGKIHERFISRRDAGIGGGAHKESASYGTMFKAIALKRFEIIKNMYCSHRK